MTSRPRLIAVASALAATLAVTIALTPATAAPRATPQEVVQESGRYVAYRTDGDTLSVTKAGAGKPPASCWPDGIFMTKDCEQTYGKQSVRLMSIQALEINHAKGLGESADDSKIVAYKKDQCHAQAAKRSLERLAPLGAEVQLRSARNDSSSYNRLRRAVYVKQTNGTWLDVQAELLKQGLVMPMMLPERLGENVHNLAYTRLAQKARSAKLGIWNPNGCGGTQPAKGATFAMDVRWDADGSDTKNINDEWMRVRNTSRKSASVAGWTARTASFDMCQLPRGTKLKAGGALTIHSGTYKGKTSGGTASNGEPLCIKGKTGHFYIGSKSPIHQNYDPSTGRRTTGGGAYLYDSRGNVRASLLYPYVGATKRYSKATKSKHYGLSISKVVYNPTGDESKKNKEGAKARRGEYVRITNTSRTKTRSMTAFQLTNNGGYTYTFPRGTKIKPRASLYLRVGKGKNTAKTKFWNQTTPRLNNSGGSVSLVTWDGVQVACRAWGTKKKAKDCTKMWPNPLTLTR